MKTRLAAAVVAICAVCGLPPAALAAGGLTGTYATTIKGDKALNGKLNGRWTLAFTKAGAYTVTDNGAAVIHGRYSTTGSTIQFGHETGPASCSTAGRYRFARAGRTLRLTRLTDACPGRTGVLSHVLTRTA